MLSSGGIEVEQLEVKDAAAQALATQYGRADSSCPVSPNLVLVLAQPICTRRTSGVACEQHTGKSRTPDLLNSFALCVCMS